MFGKRIAKLQAFGTFSVLRTALRRTYVKPTTPKPFQHKPQPAPSIEHEYEKREYFESKEDLSSKLDTLAKWIKESKHCMIFTGAGISTSTGIPDFRSGMNTVLKTGPGAWELRAKSASRLTSAKIISVRAIPSVAHMAVVKLQNEGLVKFTVSQNVDGLHLRSGICPDRLSELHGNTNLEKCTKCGASYLRDFSTRNAFDQFDHITGRYCDNPSCHGLLRDTIINFDECLPEEDLARAKDEAMKADLCITLGSSLRVNPSADIPAAVIRNGQRVVICNLQKTPLSPCCALEIHAQIDDVMIGVMKRLGLEIPPFTINRRLSVDVTDGIISFQGLDVTRDVPYSFMRSVEVNFIESVTSERVLLTNEPYVMQVPPGVTQPFKARIIIRSHGHYNEPDIELTEEFARKTMFSLSYEPRHGGAWNVTRN